MPVGTAATVKALSADELRGFDARIILANTYHLWMRPGRDVIADLGGLHAFMAWDRNILTDSGGFQVFSLESRRDVSDAGVRFRSHLDGSQHEFTPENVVGFQEALGVDVAMALDVCVKLPASAEEIREAVRRTTLWAKRCAAARARSETALFGIVQGGLDEALRARSASELIALDLPGYAIGGLSVGESREDLYRFARFTASLLPEDKPRYLMGVGTIPDLVNGIDGGVDMFDCVYPTRCGRNGRALGRTRDIAIRNAEFSRDTRPLDETCSCVVCATYTRAYLSHLFRAAEIASIDDACERVSRASAPTPLVFLGLRGLGKTVLLNEVRNRTRDGVHLHLEVGRDLSLTRSLHSAIALVQRTLEPGTRRFGKAIESVLRHLPLPSYELPHDMGALSLTPPPEDHDPESRPVGRAIAELAEAVAALKRYLVITLDELQNADIAAFQSLVAVVHQSAGTRHPILFASGGLPEATIVLDKLHTYAKRWDRFDLDFLTRAETVEAIRVPLSQAGVTIDDDALDLLVSEAAGYPFFVQKYASTVWNTHRGHTITRADIDTSLPGVRAMVEKTYYADEFRDLSPRERLFCNILAGFGSGGHELRKIADELGVKSSAIGSVRSNLIRKGIVFSPAAGLIAFRMPLADRYVRDHASFFFDPAAAAYRTKLAAS